MIEKTDDFRILDVHHHVGSAFLALGGEIPPPSGGAMDGAAGAGPGAAAAAQRSAADAELAARLEIMDGAGVDQAVVIPGHGYLRPRGLPDTRAENDLIARYRDRMPSRFPAALGIVEPAYGDACFAELERCKDELGLAGISFHTRFQGVSLDSRFILAYVAKMAELGLLPVIHAMNETPEEALWKLAVVARSVPDTEILALDTFGSYEATRECFFIAEVAPNLCFDTSLSYNFDFIEDFARAFGAERVVFGTDLYSHPVGRRISHLLPQIKASSLSREQKEAILSGNARRLFRVA